MVGTGATFHWHRAGLVLESPQSGKLHPSRADFICTWVNVHVCVLQDGPAASQASF